MDLQAGEAGGSDVEPGAATPVDGLMSWHDPAVDNHGIPGDSDSTGGDDGEPGNAVAAVPYLLALPRQRLEPAEPLRLLISVHGVTRQPLEHARALLPLADAAGAALLVPWFDDRRHRRYQQLIHPRRGTRSDLALIAAVEHAEHVSGCRFAPWALFGYSGGAQFAHRFALLHGRRLAALGLGAAGWYTLPSAPVAYPLGLADAAARFGQEPDLPALLRLRIRLWVGECDNEDDRHLRRREALDEMQGRGRLDRARHWLDALHDLGRAHGKVPDATLALVPGAGHSFVQCARRGMAQALVESLLLGASAAAPTAAPSTAQSAGGNGTVTCTKGPGTAVCAA